MAPVAGKQRADNEDNDVDSLERRHEGGIPQRARDVGDGCQKYLLDQRQRKKKPRGSRVCEEKAKEFRLIRLLRPIPSKAQIVQPNQESKQLVAEGLLLRSALPHAAHTKVWKLLELEGAFLVQTMALVHAIRNLPGRVHSAFIDMALDPRPSALDRRPRLYTQQMLTDTTRCLKTHASSCPPTLPPELCPCQGLTRLTGARRPAHPRRMYCGHLLFTPCIKMISQPSIPADDINEMDPSPSCVLVVSR